MVARRGPSEIGQDIGAVPGRVLVAGMRVHRLQRLAREDQSGRAGTIGERDLPALRCLDRVCRPQHQHVRDRPQGRQVFDRLMCRAVAADADGILREDKRHR